MNENQFKQKNKTPFSDKNLLGALFGGIGGYLYSKHKNNIPKLNTVTSKPWFSMLWGAIIGFLIANLFGKKKN